MKSDLESIQLRFLQMAAEVLNQQGKQSVTADGAVDRDELEDFISIQEELERISITVETLQLWSEKMLATSVIDIERYNALKGGKGS